MFSSITKLYDVLENPSSRWFSITNNFFAFLTILSILSISLESVFALQKYSDIFLYIEYFVVVFFSIEYIIRFMVKGRKYSFSFFGIIDLLAVLPTLFIVGNLTLLKSVRILRILRFLRMLRLIKIARIAIAPITDAEEKLRIEKLNLQIYFFSFFSAVLLFGALIYAAEGYREEFSNIFLGMIWSTKVILGGMSQFMPETIWGDIISVLARFTGLVLFGLLITVVGSFMKKILLGEKL